MVFPILSCAEIRAREHRAIHDHGMPSLLLMENAGRGMADLLVSLGVAGKVVICCGKGNNGGDGLVLARHLDNRGIRVHVFVFAKSEELSPDSVVNHRALTGSEVAITVLPGSSPDVEPLRFALATCEWVVDALFGTGLRGPLKAPFDQVVDLINAGSARVFAADIPSGLDGDSGQPLGPTVRANHTATLIAWKAGFVKAQAAEWTGQVHLLDVGIPRSPD
jgi:NAD(P)H-hydrate epimerase